MTDGDGKPVADAEVGVFHPMKHNKAEPKAAKGDKPIPVVPQVKSDDKGAFTISDVPTGDYMIRVFLKGEGQARENVTVTAARPPRLNLRCTKVTALVAPAPACSGRRREACRSGEVTAICRGFIDRYHLAPGMPGAICFAANHRPDALPLGRTDCSPLRPRAC